MARHSNILRAGANGPAEEVDAARSEALAYWEYQEQAPLMPQEEAAENLSMPSGWWILPVALLSLPAWTAIFMLIF